jgi:hypothetical protein
MPVVREKHEAVVSSIEGFEDGADEKRGMISVICPALSGPPEDETAPPLPILCEPAHDWGWFYIPDVGEQVEIEVVVSSDRDEVFGQAALEALRPVWRGKRYHTDSELGEATDGSEPRPIHDDFVSTNYGKRRGFATPWGHVLLFDDTEGEPRIYLTHSKEQLAPGETPDPEKVTRVEIEPDGSIKMRLLDKHELRLSAEDGQLSLSLDNGASVVFGGKDGGATLTLGDGAKHVPIVEALQALYDQLKLYIEGAVVPTSMGPSGPILSGSGPAPLWDPGINSSKVSIPDG